MNPTEERFMKCELAERLSNEWAIEPFLEVFPQPVEFFENPARKSEIEKRLCMIYLENNFPNMFSKSIEEIFVTNNHNLVLTAFKLMEWKGLRRRQPRPVGSATVVRPKRDIANYIIETAYIENRTQIKEYISKKEARRRDYKGDLFTCCCCFEDDLLPEDMLSCQDGHFFCKTCIRRGSEVIIVSGKARYTCLNGDCKAEFSLVMLEGILASNVLKKLVQNLQTEEINAASIEGLETCPSCPYAAIPDPEDKIFKCLNPDCMKIICRKCKRKNHLPLRCEEMESTQTKMRTYIENKMTDALVRTCWKCKKTFIKEGGCNKMVCTCGAMMCYLCRQPVSDYSHFNQYPEIRSNDTCDLFTDDRKVNFNAIKSEGIKAKKEVMRQNPKVKLVHDPTSQLLGIK